jgi:Fur family ferric uptake transcriptional regulator
MAARADGKRSWDEHARSKLAVAGRRAGRARELVITLLAEQQCCLTANEIVDRLRADGRRVGIASVYRALDQLVGLRLVQRLDFPDAARFEPMLPTGEHHHHLVCDDCGRVEPFADRGLERALDRVGTASGYEVGAHDVVLRGACATCRA